MTYLISFPFRLGTQGNVVTLQDDSNDYYSEELAVLTLTRPGERTQAPDFGINDPTFDHIDAQELAVKVGTFGIPVAIAAVETRQLDAYRQNIVIYFEPMENDEIQGIRVPVTEEL